MSKWRKCTYFRNLSIPNTGHAKGVYLIKRNVVLPKTETEKTEVSESPIKEKS
jgi:hypothetical protein